MHHATATYIDASPKRDLYSPEIDSPRQFAPMKPMLFGKYCLLERISVGGMAEVFRAKPFDAPDFQGYLALKRILPHLAEDDEFIMMFVDEAKLTVQLQHPNIVRIYELGQFQSSYYILMEYIAGRDLLTLQKRVRKRRETIGVELSVFIAREVARGLHYAHTKADQNGQPLNIIHRDISPQNVLIDYRGQVKVIDFGIAKAAVQSTRTQVGVLKGKMGYMSPEQVKGLTLDPRSDVFAIGTVMWEMLTNRRLFNGANEFETMQMVKEARVVRPSEKNPDIPPEVDELVMRALTEERDERYASAAAMADALDGWILSRGINEETLSTWMREVFAEELSEEIGKQDEFAKIKTADDVRKILFAKDENAGDSQEQQPEEQYEKTEIWDAEILPDEHADLSEFAAQHTVVQAGGFDPSQLDTSEQSPPQLPNRPANVVTPIPLPNQQPDQTDTVERAPLMAPPPVPQKADASFSAESTNPHMRAKPKSGGGGARLVLTGIAFVLFMAICVLATYVVGTKLMVPPTGGVLVTVENTDTATIKVDGKPVIGIPARADELSVGDHLLEVTADGFKPHQAKVTVAAEKVLPINVKLKPTKVEVKVPVKLPELPGMRVYLNGEPRLPEEVEPHVVLPKGTHLFEVTATDMQPWREFLEIQDENSMPQVNVTMKPIKYSVEVTAEERSVLRHNGERLGTVPVTVDLDPFEVHKLEISIRAQGVSRWSGYFALPEIATDKLALSYDLSRKGHRSTDFGFVTIDTGSDWYSVWIDNVDTGLTTPIQPGKPLPISIGEHTISLRRGFKRHDKKIDVRKRETFVIRENLKFEWDSAN